MNINKRLVLLAWIGVSFLCSADAFSMSRFADVKLNDYPAFSTFSPQFAVVGWRDLTQHRTGGSIASSPAQDALTLLQHNGFINHHDVEHHNALQPSSAGYALVLAKNDGEDHHQHRSRQGGKTPCADLAKDRTKSGKSTQINCQPEDASVSANPQPMDHPSQPKSSPNICGSRLCFDPSPTVATPK